MNQTEKITIGIVNYNGGNTIKETLDSIYNLDYPDYEVIVVDNGSTDGSLQLVQKLYPKCKTVALQKNMGLPEARNVCIKSAGTKWIFLLDNDIIVSKDCLKHLINIALNNPLIVALHPQMMDKDNANIPQLYNGGYIHYICAFIPRDKYPKPLDIASYEIFPTVSSGALMLNRDAAFKIGLYDSDYFFNWEDGDFTIRLTGAGYKCVNVPGAKVYHILKPRGRSKVFYQVRNRWYFILKIYNIKTLLLIIPALLFYEISQAVLIILKRSFADYIKANISVIKDLVKILRKRSQFHKLKQISDRELLTSGNLYIPSAFMGGRLFILFRKIYIKIFNLYWELILRWL